MSFLGTFFPALNSRATLPYAFRADRMIQIGLTAPKPRTLNVARRPEWKCDCAPRLSRPAARILCIVTALSRPP